MREDGGLFDDLIERHTSGGFWDDDRTVEFSRADTKPLPHPNPEEYLARRALRGGSPLHARRGRVWVPGVIVGLLVGVVLLGGGWLAGRYATPPVEIRVPTVKTVTLSPEPSKAGRVSVSPGGGWRTRTIEISGPTKTVSRVVPGPIRTMRSTVTATVRSTATATEYLDESTD